MKFPNKYLRNLKPYKLASHKIWTVAPEKRQQMLKLDWNESTIPPSPKVMEAVHELLQQPTFFNLYPATYNEQLLKCLSEYVCMPMENVQYFGSSDVLHEYICKAFISVGDPVMILGPSYDNFRLTCQANGADVFFSNYKDDFTFDAERFENDIVTREPAVVYICNPNNPTGNVHSKEYVEHLLQEYPDTLFLIDEAYWEFSGVTVKDLVLQYDNILISRTMSKAFGLANIRVGYLVASKDNVQFINKIRNPKNVSTIAQVAACAALEDADYMWRYVDAVHEGKQYFAEACKRFENEFAILDSAGNFVLVEFKSYEAKVALLNYLAEHDIFVRDTTQAPMVRNCFRITIGTKEQMEHVVNIINQYYAQ